MKKINLSTMATLVATSTESTSVPYIKGFKAGEFMGLGCLDMAPRVDTEFL